MESPIAGLLIAFEGIDGAGKSTQVKLLANRLRGIGHRVVTTAEPTQGPWGQKIRDSARVGRMNPNDELAAFVADRRQHVDELIRPRLEAGDIVIIDRYYFSTVAYQGARGLDLQACYDANAFAPRPTVLVIFDIDPRVGLERVRQRNLGADLFEKESELHRAREIFLSMKFTGLLQVNASLPLQTIENTIWDHVRTYLDT